MTRRVPPSPLAGEGPLPRSDSRVRGRRELLLERARAMRRERTPAEEALWRMLRDRRLEGYKFRNQVRIDPYIADFVCLSRRLIIEVDGSQHAENGYDARRDAYLKRQGFSVLRFWNNDILNHPAEVFDAIFAALTPPHPPKPAAWAPPSPARGEGLGDENA